jgi:Peptidase M50B-like
VNRAHQWLLIIATAGTSWLGMQALHELGHVLGAWLTGGRVAQVVLDPTTISRTDLSHNPHPLIVAWAGPIFGVLMPLALWAIASASRMRGVFVLRFFSGFCLVANGLYIGIGSINGVGDCGEMLRLGSPLWLLVLFGTATVPFGFWIWHRQGTYFGLGSARGSVDRGVTYLTVLANVGLVLLGLLVGGS